MADAPRIGWIVDAQNDFMRPDGRLYVRDLFHPEDRGAIQIVPALVAGAHWMRTHCELRIYTGDWHGPEDPEIDPVAPDATKGTYPPHCMGRSDDPEERAGAEIISEIRPRQPVYLPSDAPPEEAAGVVQEALDGSREIFVQKTRFDVFEGNRAAEALLEAMKDRFGPGMEVYVMGVARDVCVTQAVDGLQSRGIRVVALRDATWGLGLEPEEETLARWSKKGRILAVSELPA